MTPYEAWTRRKPSLGHLRVFGCVGHTKISTPHLKKLDDRSKQLVYFGVEEGSKAHIMYDPENNKIVVSRDVVFEEKKVWNWESAMGQNVSSEVIVENDFEYDYVDFGVNDAVAHEEEADDAAVSVDSGAELPQSPAQQGEQIVRSLLISVMAW